MDDLKKINDNEGHQVGDAALQEIARTLQRATRSSFDCVFRNSTKADEFGILLPGTSRHQGLEILKRLKEKLSTLQIDGPKGKVDVRASVGMATLRADQLGNDPASAFERLLETADQAMYKAKTANKAARQQSSL